MVNYQKDMKIDPLAIDVENFNQPELARRYVKECSRIMHERDLAHENLKTVRSELIQEANSDPLGCCDKEKPNAADIEAYYRTHDKYKEAKEELLDLEDQVRVVQDMKSVVVFNRQQSINNAIELLRQQYFAGPRVPRNIENEMKGAEPVKKKKKLRRAK